MGKAIVADWQLAQSLFVGGMGCTQIAKRLGVTRFVVSKRASRGEWDKLRVATAVVAGTEARIALRDESGLGKASMAARASLSTEVLTQLEHLKRLPLGRCVADASERASLSRTVAETCKIVYGWDAASAQRTIINVQLMDQANPRAQAQLGPASTAERPTSEASESEPVGLSSTPVIDITPNKST